ncbi:MAG: type II CAAX endopeptidase family protein [Crocinitomicaceae bacterium]|nr:type II CAAX endopeptidase family protein [Crocinitomicaceae bacterium]
MNYADQAKKGQGNFGTYLLTICIALMAMIVGNMIAEMLATSFLGFSLAQIPADADFNSLLSLMIVPFAAVLIALTVCIKHLHKRPIVSLFTARESFDWKRFFTSFLIWGGVLTIALIIGIATGQPYEWNFNATKFMALLPVSLILLPLQTASEDVLFRGYLFQGFTSVFKRALPALLLSGVLFGLLHWANPEVDKIGDILLVYYIATGIFLGLMTHMDNGLELGMGYHAVNNIFASLIVTSDWQAFQTDALFVDKAPPSFGWEAILTLVVLQPLLLIIFSKMYKWGNWKQRLSE